MKRFAERFSHLFLVVCCPACKGAISIRAALKKKEITCVHCGRLVTFKKSLMREIRWRPLHLSALALVLFFNLPPLIAGTLLVVAVLIWMYQLKFLVHGTEI